MKLFDEMRISLDYNNNFDVPKKENKKKKK